MNKWIEHATYEKWEYANRSQLMHDHKKEHGKSYEEFCMGIWQAVKKV